MLSTEQAVEPVADVAAIARERLTPDQLQALLLKLSPVGDPVGFVGGVNDGSSPPRRHQQSQPAETTTIPATKSTKTGQGWVELRWKQRGGKVYGPYEYLVTSVGGKKRVKYLGKPKGGSAE